MGRDKALALFGGRRLIEIALATLREAGVNAAIAGARSDLSGFGPVVEDSVQDEGPLAGICAAIASTGAERIVFVSVDLPLLPGSLITAMLGHARITGRGVTVASVNGFAQTFPVVLDRALLPTLERRLDSGEGGCFAAFEAAAAALGEPMSVLPVEALAQCGQVVHGGALPAAWWFLNVNSPGDLERAEAIMEGMMSETGESNRGTIA
jgi:molybdopterin-guanine dinucleotide biosynthesis protein A